MPYAIDADRARRRLSVIGTDPVALPDVLAVLDWQIADGAWSYATLHDARHVTWIPTDEDIRVIVAFVDNTSQTLGPRGPVAFVAAVPALAGMVRMYSRIGEGSALRAQIFSDRDAAARWLDEVTSKKLRASGS